MRKFLISMGLFLPVFSIGLFIYVLNNLRPEPQSLCNNIPAEVSTIYYYLGEENYEHSPLSLWIHVNSECQFCHYLLTEISQWNTNVSVNLVSSQAKQTSESWVDQYSWKFEAPTIWSIDDDIVADIFCRNATPITLVYFNGGLIYRQIGFGKNNKLKNVLDTL